MGRVGSAHASGERDALDVTLRVGALVAGRYRIEGKLGHGGHGLVYAARHEQSQQSVALKVLHDDADPDAMRRFEREARLVGALHHPNTVRLLDFGATEHGEPFLAMELVRGQTLEQRLRELDQQDATMSEDEATAIILQMLRALQEAHAIGLVHRDLKPANVMLCDVMDGEIHVKLLDFGIACTTDPAFAQSGAGLGTPAYMSPEQCDALAVDARSDLYAVGVIAFRCLTGRLPFSDPDPLAVLRMHVLRPAPDVRTETRARVSAATANAVQRALAKKPAHRFDSARDMCEAISGRTIAAAVTAAPTFEPGDPTATQTWGTIPRRSPRVAWAVGVMTTVSIVAGSWFSAHRAAATAPPAPQLARHAAARHTPLVVPENHVAAPQATLSAAPESVVQAAAATSTAVIAPVATPRAKTSSRAGAHGRSARLIQPPAAADFPPPVPAAAPVVAVPETNPNEARQTEKMTVD